MTEDKLPETKRTFRRRLGRIMIWGNFLLLVVLALILYAIYFLPGYLQHDVLPGIVSELPFDMSDAKIRRFGIDGADLSDIYLSDKVGSSVLIPSLRVDYSPAALLFNDTIYVKRLALSGVSLKCVIKDGSFYFPGMKFLHSNLSGQSLAAPPAKSKYKIRVDRIDIEQGTFILVDGSRSFRVPFSLSLSSVGDDPNELMVYGKLFPRSNPVDFASKINLENKRVSISGRAGVLLRRFADVMPQGLDLKGKAELDFKADASFSPLMINDLKAECRLRNCWLRHSGLTVRNAGEVSKLSISGKGKTLRLDWSGFELDAGIPLMLNAVRNTVTMNDDGIDIVTRADCTLTGLPGNLKPASPVKITPEVISRYKYNGKWSIRSLSKQPLSAGFKVAADKNILTGGPLLWTMNADNESGSPRGRLNLNMKNVKASGPEFRAGMAEIKLTAGYADGAGTGKLLFVDGHAASDKLKIMASGVQSQISFKFLQGRETADGILKIGSINWKNKNIGCFNSTIKAGPADAGLKGVFTCGILPELKIDVSSHLGWSDGLSARLHAAIPGFKVTEAFQPGKFVPAMQGMKVTGTFTAGADIDCRHGQIKSSARLSVVDAAIRKESASLAAEGINMKLNLPDLMPLRSSPDQKLSFRNIKVGTVDVYDGVIDFQIESPESVLIEKSSFGWCGGHLYSHAMRIVPGRNLYRAMIFCDGIVLSQMLNELDIARASGAGEVMGRIPVVFDRRGLTFDSGFLFSVPGEGNKLKLVDTDKLLNGIPKESAQYAQLDIANEALKDFDYQWVKVNLATKDDALNVKMQIDGKPADLLPFEYNRKKGYFVRVKGPGE